MANRRHRRDDSTLYLVILVVAAVVFSNPVPPSEYEEMKKSCESPGDNKNTKILCEAFTTVSQNLGAEDVFADSMKMFEGEPAEKVCAAMKQSFTVLPQPPSPKDSFRKSLSSSKGCPLLCSEVNDENPDEVTVLPICKVIAFQLDSLVKLFNSNKEENKNAAINSSVIESKTDSKQGDPPQISVGSILLPPSIPVNNINDTVKSNQIENKPQSAELDKIEVQSTPNVSKINPPETITNKDKVVKPLSEVSKAETATPVLPQIQINGSKEKESKTDEAKAPKEPSSTENLKNVPPADEQQPPNKPVLSSTTPKFESRDDDYGGGQANLETENDDEEDDFNEEPNANIESNNNNNNPDSFISKDKQDLFDDADLNSNSQQTAIKQNSHKAPEVIEDNFFEESDSNFFAYFMFFMLICILGYVTYHNRSKVLALMLEGRRSNSSRSGSFSRKKHTAAYRKLDSNLEEAISSPSGPKKGSQIIY